MAAIMVIRIDSPERIVHYTLCIYAFFAFSKLPGFQKLPGFEPKASNQKWLWRLPPPCGWGHT
jgi:hypothetical protein